MAANRKESNGCLDNGGLGQRCTTSTHEEVCQGPRSMGRRLHRGERRRVNLSTSR